MLGSEVNSEYRFFVAGFCLVSFAHTYCLSFLIKLARKLNLWMNVPFVSLFRSALINRLLHVLFVGASALRFECAGSPWLNFSLVIGLFLSVTATSGTLRFCSFPKTKIAPARFSKLFSQFPSRRLATLNQSLSSDFYVNKFLANYWSVEGSKSS